MTHVDSKQFNGLKQLKRLRRRSAFKKYNRHNWYNMRSSVPLAYGYSSMFYQPTTLSYRTYTTHPPPISPVFKLLGLPVANPRLFFAYDINFLGVLLLPLSYSHLHLVPLIVNLFNLSAPTPTSVLLLSCSRSSPVPVPLPYSPSSPRSSSYG